MAIITKKSCENSRNRYQFSDHQAFSRIAPVTGECYMTKKSEIWQMTIPDFQVLAQNTDQTGDGFRVQKMTI